MAVLSFDLLYLSSKDWVNLSHTALKWWNVEVDFSRWHYNSFFWRELFPPIFFFFYIFSNLQSAVSLVSYKPPSTVGNQDEVLANQIVSLFPKYAVPYYIRQSPQTVAGLVGLLGGALSLGWKVISPGLLHCSAFLEACLSFGIQAVQLWGWSQLWLIHVVLQGRQGGYINYERVGNSSTGDRFLSEQD